MMSQIQIRRRRKKKWKGMEENVKEKKEKEENYSYTPYSETKSTRMQADRRIIFHLLGLPSLDLKSTNDPYN